MDSLAKRTDATCVLGPYVVYAADAHKDLAGMHKLAEFSSFAAAVMALKIVRSSKDWLRAAELTLNDADFLSVQVLARRLAKGGSANQKSSIKNQLFSENETGIGFSADLPSLDDLI